MSTTLTLDAKLNLRSSEALTAKLQELRGSDIEIDGTAVTHLGAHATQTLLSAAASWANDGKNFRIVDLSEAGIGHLKLMGLALDSFNGGEAAG